MYRRERRYHVKSRSANLKHRVVTWRWVERQKWISFVDKKRNTCSRLWWLSVPSVSVSLSHKHGKAVQRMTTAHYSAHPATATARRLDTVARVAEMRWGHFCIVLLSRLITVYRFLGAFGELRKATISFAMSVRPTVCPHRTTRLSLDGFSWNLIFEDFSKIRRKYSSVIKIWPE